VLITRNKIIVFNNPDLLGIINKVDEIKIISKHKNKLVLMGFLSEFIKQYLTVVVTK
jgi:hypothetical protein